MPDRVRRLIVTADDVGLHQSMTMGAIRAHRDGIVTACSIVAGGVAFDHAVTALREVPALEVGMHLALVEERPLIAPERVASLVGANGRFHSGYLSLASRYFRGALDLGEVELEFRAQLERVAATGLRITHLNGHQHLHLLPRIFELVLRLADEYSIGYVRTISDRGGKASLSRRAAIALLNRFGRLARSRAEGHVFTCERSIGVTEAGHLGAERLVRLLGEVEGVTELVTHPGDDDQLLGEHYAWRYAWRDETDALCDPRLKQRIGELGIELIAPSAVDEAPLL